MDKWEAPNLVASAACLEVAHTQIKEAVRHILGPDEASPLVELAGLLGKIAAEFRAGRQLAGLRIRLVSPKAGAAAMGASRSEKKLAGLARARAVLAETRRLKAERRMIRSRVAKHTSHPV